jgi:hypothetical protein
MISTLVDTHPAGSRGADFHPRRGDDASQRAQLDHRRRSRLKSVPYVPVRTPVGSVGKRLPQSDFSPKSLRSRLFGRLVHHQVAGRARRVPFRRGALPTLTRFQCGTHRTCMTKHRCFWALPSVRVLPRAGRRYQASGSALCVTTSSGNWRSNSPGSAKISIEASS